MYERALRASVPRDLAPERAVIGEEREEARDGGATVRDEIGRNERKIERTALLLVEHHVAVHVADDERARPLIARLEHATPHVVTAIEIAVRACGLRAIARHDGARFARAL